MTKNWRGWDILPYSWPKGDEPKERTVMSEKQEPTGSWPQYDPAAIKDDKVEIAIQVNGKVQGRMMVDADTADLALAAMAVDWYRARQKGRKHETPAAHLVLVPPPGDA